MTSRNLQTLFGEWTQWCATADRSEDGWESDYPQWQALIAVASQTMTHSELRSETARILAECWSASQEDEELLSFATDHLDECWPTLRVLARSSLPGCRWQVYEALAGVGRPAEGMLRQGLLDEDPYARRRALMSLAKVRPGDAQELAERFTRDPDPYMRQSAIEMILASEDKTFQRNAIVVLKADPVEHVRRAAEAAWQKIAKV